MIKARVTVNINDDNQTTYELDMEADRADSLLYAIKVCFPAASSVVIVISFPLPATN